MEPNVFNEKHRVTYYETGMNNRIELSALLSLILLVSSDQSDHLGISFAKMRSQGLGWVVVQYSIHIIRLPKTNEVIQLSTSSTAYNSLFANRRFKVTDLQGRTEIVIDSNWIMLDLDQRRLAPLRTAWVKPYGGKKVMVLPHLKRPQEIQDQAAVMEHSYRVRYQDIDMNRHVNNACYLDWMMDVLPLRFLTRHVPKRIDLKFRKEVHYGTVVQSRVEKVESHHVLTRHEIVSNHQLNAVANVLW